MSEIGKRIGRRIRELRTQRSPSWTQEDLAERAHISVSFLSMIERGERVAHVETLAKLAEALNVSLSELFAMPMGNGSDENNVVRPLADFARSKRLTDKDIEKLLGVARAMFSGANSNGSVT